MQQTNSGQLTVFALYACQKATRVRVRVPLIFLDKQKTLPTNQFQKRHIILTFVSIARHPGVVQCASRCSLGDRLHCGLRLGPGDCQVRSQEIVKSAEWPF